jgi:hypothetical protein
MAHASFHQTSSFVVAERSFLRLVLFAVPTSAAIWVGAIVVLTKVF